MPLMRMDVAGMKTQRAGCASDGQALVSEHGLTVRIHEEGVEDLAFIRSSTVCMSPYLIA